MLTWQLLYLFMSALKKLKLLSSEPTVRNVCVCVFIFFISNNRFWSKVQRPHLPKHQQHLPSGQLILVSSMRVPLFDYEDMALAKHVSPRLSDKNYSEIMLSCLRQPRESTSDYSCHQCEVWVHVTRTFESRNSRFIENSGCWWWSGNGTNKLQSCTSCSSSFQSLTHIMLVIPTDRDGNVCCTRVNM